MTRNGLRIAIAAATITVLLTPPSHGQATGACCFVDFTCYVLTEEGCGHAGGFYWEEGAVCDPNPCGDLVGPGGACCMEDCTCRVLIEEGCLQAGGSAWIEGEACDPNPCHEAVGPCGACCFEEYWECEVTREDECVTAGGEWAQGWSCSSCQGACCTPDYECLILPEWECQELDGYFISYTDCDPHPCPPPPEGACCLPGGECVLQFEFECSDGVWLPGYACDPNPCPTVCACCFADGSCEICTPEGCVELGGEVMPPETVCDPNPCGVAGVTDDPRIQTTWGRVKSAYR
jgi:hypothetical protein